MIFAIDFDGTCVTHEYPNVGQSIQASTVLNALLTQGHSLVLNTMRSGKELQDAVDWFKAEGIPLAGIQYAPNQTNWTSSNKCYANYYIDDAALGCPLRIDLEVSARPFVDWPEVRKLLIQMGVL